MIIFISVQIQNTSIFVQTKSSQRNSCLLYFPLDLFHAVILFQRNTLLFSFDFFLCCNGFSTRDKKTYCFSVYLLGLLKALKNV